MLRILIKKLSVCFAGLIIFITCTACEANASYPIRDYLNDLSIASGIGTGMDISENFEDLYAWGITDRSDTELFDKKLDYDYLAKTIGRLIEADGNYLTALKDKGYISSAVKGKNTVERETAEKVISKAVEYINEGNIESLYEAEFTQEVKSEDEELEVNDLVYRQGEYQIVTAVNDDGYEYREAEYDEVYESLDFEGSYIIDFTQAEVIPYGEEEIDTSYINEKYTLLSSKNHVFNTDGFRVSYTLNTSGIDVHVSKNENGMNVYVDVSINNVNPKLKWHSKEDDLKNCLFNVSFNSTEKLGVSTGKYRNYHLKFKDLDSSSFKSLLDSMVEPAKDELEATIPICKIKTPIPNVPTAFLNLDLLIKLYASGKAEFVLYNKHNLGFETKNGQIRYINDNTHDLNGIIQASAKAALGINLGLEAAGMKLADAELDGGIKGVLKATLHLYEDDGSMKSTESDVSYSALMEIAQDNPDVKVCGDISLYWMLDLIINTSRTKMNKMGFTRTFNILDDDNQVFGNLHHIENGHFVEKCTRTGRAPKNTTEFTKSNRIVLDSYAEVLKKGETYQIIVKALPDGYSTKDLVYSSSDPSIATVSNGLITAIEPGSARIKVQTSDGKHDSLVNILVSTG